MQRFKFLILFFGVPAPVLRGITVAACPEPDLGSHHCNGMNTIQLKKIRKALIGFFSSPVSGKCFRYPTLRMLGYLPFCFLLIMQKTSAQTDSNYVDTTSMRVIDTVLVSSDTNNEPGGYDDQEDGYVDTTVKHIYDTSQYFFNWKTYYNDPYSKEKITQRHLIDAEVNALKQEDDFWYIPAIEKLETRLKNDPKFRDSLLNIKKHELADQRQSGLIYQRWFNILLWVITIGIFSAAIIYFLIQNKINIFSREATSSQEDENDDAHEDIFRLSYTKLIQNAEKEKDFRVAVRLMFLQTLKLLSDTNAIQYQPDYTDLHYLQQLHQSKFYNEFFTVMRSYEYVWYGKFNISPERYSTIKNDFTRLQHKIT